MVNPPLNQMWEGFLDAAAEFDSNPINKDDDVNFFDFPPEDDVNFFGSEVQVEHHPQVQTIQGEQHNLSVDIGSSIAQELPKLHVWTKDHPTNQVIGNPNAGVQTRSTISVQNECHFSAFI